MSRAVDCFAVCGLSASPVTVSGVARGFVGAEERYLPEVLSSYPSTSSAGNNEDVGSVLAQLALMSMPEGVDVHIRDPPKEALAPRMYPLVLTESDGALVHVMCLSFLEPVSDAARAAHPALRSACARKCLCLVSRARTPMSVLRAILRAVHRTCFVRARRDAPPLADVVAALVDGVPFPERGAPPALVTVFGRPMVVPAADDDDDASDDEFRLTTSEDGEVDAVREGFRPRTESSTTPLLPDKSSFANGEDQTENRNDARATVPPPTKAWDASATDSGFELLVRALDERNAVRAACAVAEERRVVLRSKNDALLVSASMALTRTLRPLRWRHAFFPLLPIALVSATLEKPGPFIVGIKADFVVPTAVLTNAVVVDLDANDVRVFENAARGQRGSLSRDGGFPNAFAKPLLKDLKRLASREPPNAADVETSLDENENENERTLPEWARIAAHAAAARAAAEKGQCHGWGVAALANHPPKGVTPNVVAMDVAWGDTRFFSAKHTPETVSSPSRDGRDLPSLADASRTKSLRASETSVSSESCLNLVHDVERLAKELLNPVKREGLWYVDGATGCSVAVPPTVPTVGVAFVASTTLDPGTEIFFDYGLSAKPLPAWYAPVPAEVAWRIVDERERRRKHEKNARDEEGDSDGREARG